MFKRFTLLLSLAVIASISIMAVTNLWSGSQYLEGNELTVENKDGSLRAISQSETKSQSHSPIRKNPN